MEKIIREQGVDFEILAKWEAEEFDITEKTWVYPVSQSFWGADSPRTIFFLTAEERREYLKKANYYKILPRCKEYVRYVNKGGNENE